MIPFYRTLFYQIAVVFFWLMVVTVLASGYAMYNSWIGGHELALQRIQWDLAEVVAAEFTEFADQPYDQDLLQRKLYYLNQFNPAAEFFLIDDSGKLLASLRHTVREDQSQLLEPIAKFMSFQGELNEPIYGPFPAEHTYVATRFGAFSAAPVTIASRPGWVYAFLKTDRFRHMHEMYGNTSLAYAGVGLVIANLAAAILVGAAVLYLLTRRFAKMTKVLSAFRSGDYNQRIAESRNDEIGEHGKAFNQMADTIVGHINELEQIDLRRRELFANISHELRRPLTLMHAVLETLIKKFSSFSVEESSQLLHQGLDRCQGLEKLVSQLFELSKLSAEYKKPQKESFSLEDVVQDIVLGFSETASKRQILLDFDAEERLPFIEADPQMIETVVENLVENALRYTKAEGRVDVRLSRIADEVEVSVVDTGLGISADDLPRIFEPMFRSDDAIKFTDSGSGLGLALTKKILDMHGAELCVDSAAGKGSRFSFRLPRSV